MLKHDRINIDKLTHGGLMMVKICTHSVQTFVHTFKSTLYAIIALHFIKDGRAEHSILMIIEKIGKKLPHMEIPFYLWSWRILSYIYVNDRIAVSTL